MVYDKWRNQRMTATGGTVAEKHTDTKNRTMVHSGALVSHCLLRPLSSAAAAPTAIVLDQGSSSSTPPLLLRQPSIKSSIEPKPSLSSRIGLPVQPKLVSIPPNTVLPGRGQLYGAKKAANRHHRSYRSAAIRTVSPATKKPDQTPAWIV